MRLKNLARTSIMLGLILAGVCSMAAQAEDEPLPTVHTLRCTTTCAKSTDPVPDFHPLPQFPKDNVAWYGVYVEGYVVLHYTIDPDGHVSDITLLELIGPKNFADSTLNTVKSWTYKPATLDGKPVATCWTLMVNFRVSDGPVGAREEIARIYSHAVAQVKDSKLDDALATLGQAQAKPELNFYERGMLANLAGMILLQKGDYLDARDMTKLATDYGAGELRPSVVRELWETRIKASLAMGDMVDAQESLDKLKAVRFFDPASPITQRVEERRAELDSKPIFGLTGRIPENRATGEAAYFGLYRRNFAFANISGSLDSFTLSCKQQAIESKITATAEWHVPKSWSDCHILVRGAPGTTFQVAQLNE